MQDLDNDLLRYNLKNRKFIVFDFEVVEGLNLLYSRPHQLAWIEFHGDREIDRKNFYIKWPTPFIVSKRAAEITRFSQELIDREGLPPEEVFPIFHKLIYNKEYWNVGANTLNYDVMIFHNSCKRIGLDSDYSFLNRCYDVNSLFKGMKLGRDVDNNNLLSYQINCNNLVRKGLKSNVKVMCDELKIEVNESKQHCASYDSTIESNIFFELIKKINLK